jgi:hypothetical protein
MNENAQQAAALEAELAAIDAQETQPEVKPVETPKEPEAPEVVEPKVEEPKVVEPKEPEKPAERPVFTMTVDKHTKQMENLKEKHARELAEREAAIRAEYEAKQESNKKGQKTEFSDEEIKAFAEKYDTNEDSVRDLLKMASKQVVLPENLSEKLSKIDEFEQERKLSTARRQVEDDFNRDVVPLLTAQGATQEHINKIKSKIEELAFTSRYNTYPVKDIYFVNQNDFKFAPKVSAETSRGGSTVGTVDYSKVTAEDIKKMSHAEAEKYFAWEDSQGGSRYKT